MEDKSFQQNIIFQSQNIFFESENKENKQRKKNTNIAPQNRFKNKKEKHTQQNT